MATRRNITTSSSSSNNTTEKTISESQGGPPASTLTSDIRPAVPADVIYKLLAFTFAMVVMPIGSYFFTLRFVFRGNSIWAGGFAAVIANVVLIAYVIVAMREDEGNAQSSVTGVDVLKRKIEGDGKKGQ